ncbi:hypothetical protein J7382_17990 [Shimia sp. R11_0]|uniref:hypothetical protein n=1 Tax=Shimia sp. R11_0 TaxID=2821096 RepID=UPI001ADC8D51|nr:hypothetical protein [Shimia sp. R11_0]MBO9479440.1 hypothetical protein [Shimia sp. R11_0]
MIFWRFGGFWAMIAAGVVVVFTALSTRDYRDAARFDANGIEIEARVTDKRTSRSNDTTKYYLTFEYEVAGRTYGGEARVPRGTHGHAIIGHTRSIRYLAKRPGKFEFPVGDTRKNAEETRFMALIGGVAGLIALWWFGSRANHAVLARRFGERTTAEITGFVEHKNKGRGTGRGYMSWRLADGLIGKSASRCLADLEKLGVGSEIVVFRRGNKSFWEGDVGPRGYDKSTIPAVSPSESKAEDV